MKKRTKKILAREFLILLGCFIIFSITAIVLDYYGGKNSDTLFSNEQKLGKLKSELNLNTDEFGIPIKQNNTTVDSINDESVINNEILVAEIEIEKLKDSIFYNTSHLILILFWVVIIFTYGVRPLFYTTKWSFKELRN